MKKLMLLFRKKKEAPLHNEVLPIRHNFIGHSKVIHKLTPLINCSLSDNSPLDHLLFIGPFGSGRKTLCNWLAKKTGRSIHFYNGQELSCVTDLILWLDKINDLDLLVIENFETISPEVTQSLVDILNNFSLEFPNPKTKEPQTWQTPRFTMIGIVSQPTTLPQVLLESFNSVVKVPRYDPNETAQIINNWGRILLPAAKRLTQLTGNRLPLAREIYQSFFEAKLDASPEISLEMVERAVKQLELDNNFLTRDERTLVKYLIKKDKPIKVEILLQALNLTAFSTDKKKKYLEANGLISETHEGLQSSLKARLLFSQSKPFDKEVNLLKVPDQHEKAYQLLLAQKDSCVPYVMGLLSDPDQTIKTAVYRLIPMLGDNTIPYLTELLLSETLPLRDKEMILDILSNSSAPAALAALQKAARSRNTSLKLAAIRNIGSSGNKKAIPFLVRLIKKEKETVQLAVVDALEQLNTFEIISPLKQTINTVPFIVQKAILRTLRMVGDNSVVGLLDKEKVVNQHGKR